MSRFSDYWASQCGAPRGIVGRLVTWAMNRTNKVMYDGIIENIRLSKENLDKLFYTKNGFFAVSLNGYTYDLAEQKL